MSGGESGYTYADTSPIYVERGDDGLAPSYDADDMLVLYPSSAFAGQSKQSGKQQHLPLFVPNESSEQTNPVALARQHNASSKANTLARGAVVEFILFGKSHRYYASDYPLYAPHFRDKLFVEARVLTRAIQGEQAVAYEFLEGDGTLGAWLSHGIRNAKDWWKKTRGRYEAPPKPSEYDGLSQRAYSAWGSLRNATADDYPVIHSTGIEFMRIRQEKDVLTRRVMARVGGLIEAAETGEHGCEFVEESAFKVLDLYAQLRAGNNKTQLAAYRIGLMAIRAGARATGEWVADSSSRQILQTTFEAIRKDFPPIAKDLFLSFTKKGFDRENLDRQQQLAVELIGLTIDVSFIVFDVAIFESKAPQGVGQRLLDRLAGEMPTRIAHAIFNVLKAGLADNAYKSGSWSAADYGEAARKQLYERVEIVICTLIGSSIREYRQAQDTADKEKRPLSDVLLSDLGWILVRVGSDIGKAFLLKAVDARVGQWMKSRHDSEKASGRRPFSYEGSGFKEIEAQVRSLIVAFQIQVAPFNKPPAPPPATTTIVKEQRLPKLAPGPNTQGDVGMNKFASAPVMQPATQPPAPGKKASPVTPATRRKVKPAKSLVEPTVRPSAGARREGTYTNLSGELVIVSRMRKPAARKNFEEEFFRGIEVGLPGWQRAHSQGAGTGRESKQGIRYAPQEVNQEIQNQGIERYLRELYSLKPKDTELYLTTVTTTVPGTLRLKEIQYKLEAVKGTQTVRVFEASVSIEDKRESPKVDIHVEALVLPTTQAPGGKR